MGGKGIEIHIGDQPDPVYMKELVERLPELAIILDDGGHEMKQQIHSFEVLYPLLSPQGVYLCEDVHTSYWSNYGGGCRRSGTFIEHAKRLIDRLNAFSMENDATRGFRKQPVTEFTPSTDSIHFYDSVIVFEKAPREKPTPFKVGNPSW